MQEIMKVAEDFKLDILHLGTLHESRNGARDACPPNCDRRMAAVIIFNRYCAATVIRQYTDSHFVCLELTTGSGKWILVNQYYQYQLTLLSRIY